MNPPSTESGLADARRQLRAGAISAREALTATARSALTARLEAHLERLLEKLSPPLLGFCWPHRGEPDLRPFMARWLAADSARAAALPVVTGRDQPMIYRIWTPGMTLATDRYGIPHPPTGTAVVPDALLVPLNAFDAAGYRLGYGGGYFDRTLAVMAVTAIGVGFELGRSKTVFPQAHDRPMDWLVTERAAFAARRD